jgi:hypothetical protein
MLLPIVLAVATVGSSGEPYTGPRPGDEFWAKLALRAKIQPLSVHRSLRLVRVAWALTPGTIVTVVPAADGGAEVETRILPDWRKEGASVRTRKLAQDRYESLRDLAKAGFWEQSPVAPTGAPGATDGVVWYIEGLREGDTYAIVRHEPSDPRVRSVCAEFMRII